MRGEGGFDKLVAVKVPNDDKADASEIGRLKDEARMLGLLRHRSIVGVDGLALLDGRWSVVMEYVDGVDLRSLIKANGPLPLAIALEITAEVAGALHAAWEAQDVDGQPLTLMHRDIKPSNVMLTASADVKVLDFGIAKAKFETRESITQNRRLGSQHYMAPERLDLMDHATSDVYSLGAVLYGMLTGKRVGRTSPQVATHQSVIQAAMMHLRSSSASNSLDVMDLLQAMLRYNPNSRPAAQFVERRCREIVDKLNEPSLRTWSKRILPPLVERRDDPEFEDFGETWTGSTWADATAGSGSISGSIVSTMSHGVPIPPPPEKKRSRSVWAMVALTAMLGWSIALVVLGVVWLTASTTGTESDRFVPLSEGVAEPSEAPAEVQPVDSEPDGEPVGGDGAEDAPDDGADDE